MQFKIALFPPIAAPALEVEVKIEAPSPIDLDPVDPYRAIVAHAESGARTTKTRVVVEDPAVALILRGRKL